MQKWRQDAAVHQWCVQQDCQAKHHQYRQHGVSVAAEILHSVSTDENAAFGNMHACLIWTLNLKFGALVRASWHLIAWPCLGLQTSTVWLHA